MTHPAARALIGWYSEHARDLPWRNQRNPYATWVAEIMLQQTRVETVIPYYLRWMNRFPSVEALAGASIDEVLHQWEGLGYYRRAHAIYKAANKIIEDHHGELPRSINELEALPGIGPYTAAALAALAFDQDAIALDGNLRRVFSRLLDLELDPRSPEGERQIRTMAQALLPPGQASSFNQALMDLGAAVCRPRNPRCPECPLTAWCQAYGQGTQSARPVKKSKPSIPHYQASAAILHRAGKILIGRRPPDKLLGGLWEFPGGKQEPGESLPACLERELREELAASVEIGKWMGAFEHRYTHFSITVHAFLVALRSGEPQALEHTQLAWVRPDQLVDYPMGKIDRAIARQVEAKYR